MSDPVEYINHATLLHPGEEQGLRTAGYTKPGWYFWYEAWADCEGPYESREEAAGSLALYCRVFLGLTYHPSTPMLGEFI
jgi:hypothetical protein